MQGTTPTRYEADLREWPYFTQETTGIGAWNADASTATTWAYAPALRRPDPDRPSRRPLAPRVPCTTRPPPGRPRGVLRLRRRRRSHPRAPFNSAALRPAPTALPRTAPLTLEQAAALQYAADDVLPGRHRRGPYDTAPHRDRLLAYRQGRCAVCGSAPDNGRPAHTEDHNPRTGLTRGLLCHRCRPQAGQGAAPFWVCYHERPPAAVLGLELRYPALAPSRP
ncbi:endonuclease domain-containing protein [Kitasatospora sp. NPDC054795]